MHISTWARSPRQKPTKTPDAALGFMRHHFAKGDTYGKRVRALSFFNSGYRSPRKDGTPNPLLKSARGWQWRP